MISSWKTSRSILSCMRFVASCDWALVADDLADDQAVDTASVENIKAANSHAVRVLFLISASYKPLALLDAL
jgi:hypothetical protein